LTIKTNEKLQSILNTMPLTRIAAMIIVAILSCNVSGMNSMFVSLFFVVLTFIIQLLLCIKYHRSHITPIRSSFSILGFIPSILLFICFFIYSLFSGRDILYSISVSLALSALLIPRSSRYFNIVSFVLNSKDINYSNGYESCSAIKKSNNLTIDGNNLLGTNKFVDSVSTIYSYIDSDQLSSTDDYAVGILKEFSNILFSGDAVYKTFSGDLNTDYDFQVNPQKKDNLKFAVLKNKNGYRIVVAGPFDDVKKLCSDCASEDSLIGLEIAESLALDSVRSLNNKGLEVVSFAFADVDEFDDESELNDMIFVGSLGINSSIDHKALNLLNEIIDADFEITIKTNDNSNEIAGLLDTNGITNFVKHNEYIVINESYGKYVNSHLEDEKLINNDTYFELNDETASLSYIKENAETIYNTSRALERNLKMFSFSIVITFLLASVLIPNNIMHPYVIVLLSCVVEVFSLLSLHYFKTDKQTGVRDALNTFIISFCGLGLFFAGRFFVDAPMSKFDAEAVNIARSMLIYYYILLTAMYDSVAVFSSPVRHIKNIIMIVFSIIIVLVFNIPPVRNLMNFHYISLDALKYIIFFILVPVLVNAFEVLIINRKEKNNGK